MTSSSGMASAYEDVTWDRYTFHLPKRVSGYDMAGPVRNQYFTETSSSLDVASAPVLMKLNVFLSRFDHDSLKTEVDGALS
jgi:hypothetical protein